jgi:RHS repeat-associated protein
VGTIVNSYDYDSYGRIEASVEGIANPFTYTGREFDAESGLYFYRVRYYDPATGRFQSEDPIGFAAGDANVYRYVRNNPLNFVDPFGTDTCSENKKKKKDSCKKFQEGTKKAKGGKAKAIAQALYFACRLFTGQMDDAIEGGAGPLDQKRPDRPQEPPPITETIDPPPDPLEPLKEELKKKGLEPVFPPEE